MSEPSILKSVKKVLQISPDYTAFDIDILMHINSVFVTLGQLGVGPDSGYMIEDDSSTWADYLGNDKMLNMVKTYLSLSVKMLFDPPTTSYAIGAMQEQLKQMEWRICSQADRTPPVEIDTPVDFVDIMTSGDDFPADAEEGELGFDPVTGEVWRNEP